MTEKHRTQLPMPTDDEVLIDELILGKCVHRHTVQSQTRRGSQSTECCACGEFLSLHIDFEPSRNWSAAELAELWKRQLPRPLHEEAVANEILRTMEKRGWSVVLRQFGDKHACSVAREGASHRTDPHLSRRAAIVAAAVFVAKNS